jgi:hypothetical protein
MTTDVFRKIALDLPEAVEAAHVGHPDFRVRGKIFATLGYPDEKHGVLMLTPDQQVEAISRWPEVFAPVKGGWGRRGSTLVLLSAIGGEALRPWMERAWSKVAPRKLQRPE